MRIAGSTRTAISTQQVELELPWSASIRNREHPEIQVGIPQPNEPTQPANPFATSNPVHGELKVQSAGTPALLYSYQKCRCRTITGR